MPPGNRDEGVGQLGHHRLALVHRVDEVQFGEAGMRDLEIDQRLRDHAIDLAARVQHRVGDHAHQAEPPAAIDEADAAPRHLVAERPRESRRSAGSVPMLEPQ